MDPSASETPSPDERDAAIARLRTARAEGRLDEAELLMRTQAIRNAGTRGEIVRVTAEVDRRPLPLASEGRSWDVTLFGDVERRGPWGRQHNVAISLFGDIELELQEASVGTGEVAITAVSPFGDVDLTVPDGTEVDANGFTLFGSKRVSVRSVTTGRPALAVRIRGFSIFGSIKVRSR